MQRYLINRLLLLIPTLVLASIVVFAMIQFSPGDPARMMLGLEASPQEVALERVTLGLDKPVPVRYGIWLSNVVRLNLGRSQVSNRPVTTLVGEAFPNTLRLALTALVLSVLLGFPMGIFAAIRQNRWGDHVVTGLNSLGLAIPSFWLGILLILFFSVTFHWLPPSGVGESGRFTLGGVKYLIMPVVTIGVSNLSVFSRFVRSSMIDVLATDYVRTARAKGLPERAVLTRHALRNALLPVVTALGIQFGRLLGGSVITESVFAYPGIGRLVVTSILNRDYPVVQATLMLVVLVFLATNIVVDLSYAFLDPAVKFERAK